MNRKTRRAFQFNKNAAKAIVKNLHEKIPVDIWLKTQPASTHKGYSRGKFQLPANVVV